MDLHGGSQTSISIRACIGSYENKEDIPEPLVTVVNAK